MGDRFDDVAKGLARGISRRRVLKLLAGGLAAAVGSRVAGLPASADAHPNTTQAKGNYFGINQTISPWFPGLNETIPPWYPRVNQTGTGKRPGMNQGFPGPYNRQWE